MSAIFRHARLAVLAIAAALLVPGTATAADMLSCNSALWTLPYETLTLPAGLTYRRIEIRTEWGIYFELDRAEPASLSVTLACVPDAGTFYRRSMELHQLADDRERIGIAIIGDESIGYRYTDLEAYEVLWRRGDVIGRGFFGNAIPLDEAEDIVRLFDAVVAGGPATSPAP